MLFLSECDDCLTIKAKYVAIFTGKFGVQENIGKCQHLHSYLYLIKRKLGFCFIDFKA